MVCIAAVVSFNVFVAAVVIDAAFVVAAAVVDAAFVVVVVVVVVNCVWSDWITVCAAYLALTTAHIIDITVVVFVVIVVHILVAV